MAGPARRHRHREAPWAAYTNVGLEISDAERAAGERSLHNKGVIQSMMDRARKNKGRDLTLQGESARSQVVAAHGELHQLWDDTPAGKYLVPIAIIADPSWPTRNGIRKEYNREQWCLIVEGRFCFRCGWELPIPFADCPVPRADAPRPGCGWTQAQTSRAFDVLYESRFVKWETSKRPSLAGKES